MSSPATPGSALDTAWKDQAKWSKAAGRLKTSISTSRTVLLGFLITAAVAQSLAAFFKVDTLTMVLGFISAVLLAAVGIIRSTLLKTDKTKAWIGCRSISEGLKSEIYGYCTGTGGYRGSPAEREDQLAIVVDGLQTETDDLLQYITNSDAPDKEPPDRLTMEQYCETRLLSQIEGYYEPKADSLKRSLKRYRTAEIVLCFASAAIAAAAAVTGRADIALWTGMIATAIAAIVAHIEGSRYERQAVSYQATARKLRRAHSRWLAKLKRPTPPTSHDEDEFIDECERTISVENQAWMVGWDESLAVRVGGPGAPSTSAGAPVAGAGTSDADAPDSTGEEATEPTPPSDTSDSPPEA